MISLRQMGTDLRVAVHALTLLAPRHLAPDLEPLIERSRAAEPVAPQPRARHADRAVAQLDPFSSKPTGMPVKGRPTSAYGMRYHPIKRKWLQHTGEDIAAPEGRTVRATAAGVVTFAGIRGGYGNLIEIDHGNGYSTRYAHLQAMGVMVRQRVRRGDIIGAVGQTGLATGPHLHYEVLLNGAQQDPRPFLTVA